MSTATRRRLLAGVISAGAIIAAGHAKADQITTSPPSGSPFLYIPINYFDYVPKALQAGIAAGTNTTTDQLPYWRAFRDALAAASNVGGTLRVEGIIPQCTIYTSASPNFAINWCTIKTQGAVAVICTGTDPGFLANGAGLGFGAGIINLNVGPMRVSSVGPIAGDIKYCHHSYISKMAAFGVASGGTGIRLYGCIATVAEQSDTYLLTGAATGLKVTGTGSDICSWCTIIGPILENASSAGLQLENSFGTTVLGGEAENNGFGILISAGTSLSTILGMDTESNTNDVYCAGADNTFVGVTALNIIQFDLVSCKGNKWFGGNCNQLQLAALTTGNLFDGLTYNFQSAGGVIANLNVSNRIVNCINGATGAWYVPAWIAYTPAVTSVTGTLTTTSATGSYNVDEDGMVDFTVTATITTNGSGAGGINITLPFAAAGAFAFSGQEIVGTGKSLCAIVFSSSTIVCHFYDFTYPGGSGYELVVSGRYKKA